MLVRTAALAFGLTLAATTAFAQAFPAKPIRLLVGAPAGGTTDLLARGLGAEMSKLLGQQVIVENRGGAGGNIAADAVAKSAPDGYTLLMCFTSHAINASLFEKLPFDPVKDFTPISLVATSPSLLVAHKSVPVDDLTGLVAYAKQHPGKLNFAIGGTGSSLHLAGEMVKALGGLDIVNVAYRGTGPAMNDVIAGQVELMFVSVLTGTPHIKSGSVKLLGVTSARRMPAFPDAPAIGEALPGYESAAWFGLLGPAKLPPEILQALSDAAVKGARAPEFAERIAQDGGQPVGSAPQEFQALIERDIARYAAVVKATGAKVD